MFYQEKLTQSVQVKGVQYENISHLKEQFNELQLAIQQNKLISFKYKKINSEHSTFYQLEPYLLTNKNGIWYLIGTDKNQNDKQKHSALLKFHN